MVGKYIIETKDEVISGLLDFYERKNGSKSPKKRPPHHHDGAVLHLILKPVLRQKCYLR